MITELNKNVFILIPSLNPDKNLINYIKELNDNGFNHIILVNDGSSKQYDEIYDSIIDRYKCVYIKHEINKGKGSSLKDGFKYYMDLSDKDNFIGVITVDSDGQHLVKDVIKIYESLKNNDNKLILGVRDFTKDNIPKKSSFGNNLTSKIFKLLYGRKVSDTQTGLRGISNKLIDQMIYLPGNRYEYETTMLIDCISKKIDFEEVSITTIYVDNNSGTHFRPIVDSLKIYWSIFNIFLKYSFVSIVSFLIDLILFKVLFNIFTEVLNSNIVILISTVVARICSSLANYILNKKISFKSGKGIKNTIFKYYALVIVQMFVSATLVTIFYRLIGSGEVLIKIIVDTIIFIVNYKVQKKYIF